jgi:DNA-binding MarR family transcriptional regulator
MPPYNGKMGDRTVLRAAASIPGLDEAEHVAWQSFLDVALRMYATLNRALVDGHRLTLNDVRLLDLLATTPDGSARMGDLADALMSLPSRVTRQIHRLETQGLVRRTSSPDDGRGVLATISPEGRQLLADAMVTYGGGIQEHFVAKLSRAQVTALGGSCRRVNDGLRTERSATRLGRV